MKRQFSKQKNWARYIIPVLAIFAIIGCREEEPEPMDNDAPIASFQYEVDPVEFLTVTFTNFSQNATEYAWDFGDENTSSEENPTYTYAAGGTYTVTLTASDASGESATKTETVILSDPNQQLALLAGTESKTWYLQREGIALGIGPTANDNQWWSFGGVTPLGDRPCILDDSYTFYRDGRFEANTEGTIFIDSEANGGWKAEEGCWDESDGAVWDNAIGADPSGFANGGDYTYAFDNAAGTIDLNGTGAYIGLPNKTNAGDNSTAIDFKNYTIINLAEGDIADTLALALIGDGFSWNFYMVSYEDPADLPDLPASEPRADFVVSSDGLTATFTNTSANSTQYSWEFGDGGMSADKDPVHTYGAAGDYEVTLSVMDDMGAGDMITKTVSVSNASFTADVMSNADGKIWKLAGEGSYKVGPAPDSGEWWGGPDAVAVEERACQMDDEFIFSDGGSLRIDVKEEVWAEPYMGGSNACMAVGDLASPFDVYGGGDFSFEVLGDSQIRVVGEGAYLGFNKPFNAGELTDDGLGTPATEVTYEVIGFTSTAERDVVVMAIDYVGDGCCFWTITIESLK